MTAKEDLLFVSGLGLITAGVFPVLSGKTVALPSIPGRQVAARVIAIATPTAAAVAASALIGIPLIYAAPVIMVIAAVVIALLRKDLAVVALAGAAGTLIIYTGLSLIYEMLIPGVFELNWNTDAFSDVFILGIPMEELLYGASSGGVGSVVVVFVLGGTFVKRSQPDAR